MSGPASAAAPGHDREAERALVERVRRLRALDKKLLRVVRILVATSVVLGLLAAIVVPGFLRFPCRSKQSEAKGNLKALYVMQESYRAEFDRYTTSVPDLGFVPRGPRVRYAYFTRLETREHNQPGFLGVAVGLTDNVEGDIWTISEQNQLENPRNSCVR
jgi:type IV pilus assembly protein PilA